MDGTAHIATQEDRLTEARQALQSAYAILQSGNPVQALQVSSLIHCATDAIKYAVLAITRGFIPFYMHRLIASCE